MSMQFFSSTNPGLNSSYVPVGNGWLQRKCSCGNPVNVEGECQECKRNRSSIQLKGSSIQQGQNIIPQGVHDVITSSGQPLDHTTRTFMEPRFGHDFSKVKIHSDAKAADTAASLNALAYTVGEHIVFNAGKYNPETLNGRQLLAHELTHVRQQQDLQMFQKATNEETPLTTEDQALEMEALEMEEEVAEESNDVDYVDEPGLEGELPNPDEDELAALLEEEDSSGENDMEIVEADPGRSIADDTVLGSPPATAPLDKKDKVTVVKGKKIVVDLSAQTATAIEDGNPVKTMPISSGKPGHPTTPGKNFKITERDIDHRSSKYGKCVSGKKKRDVSKGKGACKKGEKYEGAPMKYFLRHNGAEGFHKGVLPGNPASHGCIRLSESNAEWLWKWTASGDVSIDVNAKPEKKAAKKKRSTPKKK